MSAPTKPTSPDASDLVAKKVYLSTTLGVVAFVLATLLYVLF